MRHRDACDASASAQSRMIASGGAHDAPGALHDASRLAAPMRARMRTSGLVSLDAAGHAEADRRRSRRTGTTRRIALLPARRLLLDETVLDRADRGPLGRTPQQLRDALVETIRSVVSRTRAVVPTLGSSGSLVRHEGRAALPLGSDVWMPAVTAPARASVVAAIGTRDRRRSAGMNTAVPASRVSTARLPRAACPTSGSCSPHIAGRRTLVVVIGVSRTDDGPATLERSPESLSASPADASPRSRSSAGRMSGRAGRSLGPDPGRDTPVALPAAAERCAPRVLEGPGGGRRGVAAQAPPCLRPGRVPVQPAHRPSTRGAVTRRRSPERAAPGHARGWARRVGGGVASPIGPRRSSARSAYGDAASARYGFGIRLGGASMALRA
jgi:hypothetical protein